MHLQPSAADFISPLSRAIGVQTSASLGEIEIGGITPMTVCCAIVDRERCPRSADRRRNAAARGGD